MAYGFLALAVLSEVAGTMALRKAVSGPKAWYAAVVLGYLAAFALMSLTLSRGMGIGVAYGIWAAAGVALTALGSRYVFDEPFNRAMAGGIALIVTGVLVIELGSAQ